MSRPFLFYLLRFALSLVAFALLVYGVSYLLAEYAPDIAAAITGGGGIVAVALVIVPPIQLAGSFFANEARQMTGAEGWGLASACALVFTGAFAGAAYVLLSRKEGVLDAVLQDIGGSTAAIVGLAVLAVVLVPVYRLFFWAGIRGHIKRALRG